jgi:hypothetical protein
MSVPLSTLIASARDTLLDASATVFTDAQLIVYANEGIAATCTIKPEVYIETLAYPLDAGMSQLITDPNISGLLEVLYNVGDGSPITLVDKKLMQIADPTWNANTAVANVKHYMYEPRTPLAFQVWPPAIEGSEILLKVTRRPSTLNSSSDTIPLPEAWYPAILFFMLARAFMKQTKKQDTAKAAMYYSQWAQAVGLRDAKDYGHLARTPDGVEE